MSSQSDQVEEMLRRAQLPEVVGKSVWSTVRAAFPGEDFDRWIDGLELLIAAELGTSALIDFARSSAGAAVLLGSEAALAIAPAGVSLRRQSGARSASAFLAVAGRAAELVKDATAFRAWLAGLEKLAELAPESVEAFLARTEIVLTRLNTGGLRSWLLTGIRSSGGDPEARLTYFSLEDERALRAFEQASSDVLFSAVERRMKGFLQALWGLRPATRTAMIQPGKPAPRRSTFDGLIFRVPEAYPGFRGDDAVAHYRAVMAHLGAHAVYSRAKFPVGSLKPVQVALVSLVEDARVEALAAREFPGLARLWRRFHVARPQGSLTAEILMPRLARALADPDYRDDDPWVNKGRMMFLDSRSEWEDHAISRRIGGLLGNDIGQMRIQFNSRTYIVQPSYRDDNAGIWDFGDPPPEEAQTAETILDAVRIEQRDEPDKQKKHDKGDADDQPASRAARMRAIDDDVGVPIARYPEWDYVVGEERPDWTTLLEFAVKPAPPDAGRALTETYTDVARRIERLVRNAKVSRPIRMRRQPQGDRLDLDACIRAAVDRRMGLRPDARVYETSVMRSRDLSVLVLLDVSESTRDRIRNTTTTVISVERSAVALLAEAMSGLHDPFAIHAFCSNTRDEVRYYRVKDFRHPYDDAARRRLAGLRGNLSTRLGAALRHAGTEIQGAETHRRLVLVVTDGEPADVDVADNRYLVEDARKAVQDLAHRGIDVFCVGLGGDENYLPRIFGRRGFLMINKLETLPDKLPMLYFRMTV